MGQTESVVESIAEQAIEVLRGAHVELSPGLSEAEIARVERVGLFRFNPDHRELLQLALPTGELWPDWRGSRDDILDLMVRPLDSILFDVEANDYWEPAWGVRPSDEVGRLEVAGPALMRVPRLVPVHSHRYCVAAPAPAGSPVFSAHQTDVIVFGNDLLDYVLHEFMNDGAPDGDIEYIPYWNELVMREPYDPDNDDARRFWRRATQPKPPGGNPLTGN
jgi:hypothetical protein